MIFRSAALVFLGLSAFSSAAATEPRVTPMQQAVVRAALGETEILAFYRAHDFAPIWTGPGATERRAAFVAALTQARNHGLPTAEYDVDAIRAAFAQAGDAREIGEIDVEMTRRFIAYAHDISAGILNPRKVDPTIVVDVPKPDTAKLLQRLMEEDPRAVMRSLIPRSAGYRRLVREKLRLEAAMAAGGWGPTVPEGTLSPGDTGPAVLALRNRLIRMGYLPQTVVAEYDSDMAAAVRAFQANHGQTVDGAVGPATRKAINVALAQRMEQVVVGLERQRWMNKPLEQRHILVNLAEQHAYVVDDGKVSFDTVVVVGADTPDRRTPEFSHTMTHMVVNPYWHVPRSIATKEYLPQLQRGGARHLEVYSRKGRVDPRRIDFSQYSASSFPFNLKQPPGPKNALGRVKFMFPNQWNIYLHDTPSRSLFDLPDRTFSHGCVRVGRPLELAYHLLAPQTPTPVEDFTRLLQGGSERRINLDTPVGVHLVYWSAWVTPTGEVNYRSDPYGRDAKVLQGLRGAGVELNASRS